MRAFKQLQFFVLVLLAALICATCSAPLLADDGKDNDKDGKGKKSAPANTAVAKPDPADLTERERMLLDRVEQLEKRVAELEAKEGVTSTPAAAATAAEAAPVVALVQPNPANPDKATGAPVANTTAANSTALLFT